MLSNRNIFFPGKPRTFLDEKQMSGIFENFKMITLESSFVVRTFFFVIFGFTIVLASLAKLEVWLVSILVLAILYAVRFTWFRLIIRKNIYPDIWLAPRGLITILLFYSIPEKLRVPHFNEGILLLVILASSIIMAVSMIKHRRSTREDVSPEVSQGSDAIHPTEDSAPPEEEIVN
jgi:NhaP-type Na+/H+ or K+/H+ antiporter